MYTRFFCCRCGGLPNHQHNEDKEEAKNRSDGYVMPRHLVNRSLRPPTLALSLMPISQFNWSHAHQKYQKKYQKVRISFEPTQNDPTKMRHESFVVNPLKSPENYSHQKLTSLTKYPPQVYKQYPPFVSSIFIRFPKSDISPVFFPGKLGSWFFLRRPESQVPSGLTAPKFPVICGG